MRGVNKTNSKNICNERNEIMKKILVWICLFVILTASCLSASAVSMVPDEETAKEHGLRILYLNINGWDTPHCYLDENDNIPNQILLRTHEKLDVSQYVKGEVAEFYGLEVFYVQYSFQWNGIYRYTVTTVDFLTDEELEAWASEHDFIATAEFSYYKELSEPAPAVKGDVNRDGAFDSMDYVLIKRSYFGTYPEEELYCDMGDLNGNREIDSMDYVLLKRAYFGTYEIK